MSVDIVLQVKKKLYSDVFYSDGHRTPIFLIEIRKVTGGCLYLSICTQ